MMNINDDPIAKFGFPETGYKPIVDYDQWRVAILKYCTELKIDNLATMQKHDETDEVFVLLAGDCVLFSGSNQAAPSDIQAIHMEPNAIYNVRRGVWHTHALDEAAIVLIVENQNTGDHNSPTAHLSDDQITLIRSLNVSVHTSY